MNWFRRLYTSTHILFRKVCGLRNILSKTSKYEEVISCYEEGGDSGIQPLKEECEVRIVGKAYFIVEKNNHKTLWLSINRSREELWKEWGAQGLPDCPLIHADPASEIITHIGGPYRIYRLFKRWYWRIGFIERKFAFIRFKIPIEATYCGK